MTSLHALFAHAPVLQIANRSRATSRSQVGPDLASPGAFAASSSVDPVTVESPNPLVFGSPLLPTNSNSTFVEPPKKRDRPLISTLKITKVGLLSRKEDLAEGGKKAQSRKWRGWSVVLTGSQLLFFVRRIELADPSTAPGCLADESSLSQKDAHFASNLQSALDRAIVSAEPRPPGHVLAFSYPGSFKPDAVLSLAHSVAIYDSVRFILRRSNHVHDTYTLLALPVLRQVSERFPFDSTRWPAVPLSGSRRRGAQFLGSRNQLRRLLQVSRSQDPTAGLDPGTRPPSALDHSAHTCGTAFSHGEFRGWSARTQPSARVAAWARGAKARCSQRARREAVFGVPAFEQHQRCTGYLVSHRRSGRSRPEFRRAL